MLWITFQGYAERIQHYGRLSQFTRTLACCPGSSHHPARPALVRCTAQARHDPHQHTHTISLMCNSEPHHTASQLWPALEDVQVRRPLGLRGCPGHEAPLDVLRHAVKVRFDGSPGGGQPLCKL